MEGLLAFSVVAALLGGGAGALKWWQNRQAAGAPSTPSSSGSSSGVNGGAGAFNEGTGPSFHPPVEIASVETGVAIAGLPFPPSVRSSGPPKYDPTAEAAAQAIARQIGIAQHAADNPPAGPAPVAPATTGVILVDTSATKPAPSISTGFGVKSLGGFTGMTGVI